jgi:hypothetical protein
LKFKTEFKREIENRKYKNRKKKKGLPSLPGRSVQPRRSPAAAHLGNPAPRPMPAHVPLRADKSEEGVVFVFATGRTGERHREDQLHVLDADKDEPDASTVPEP